VTATFFLAKKNEDSNESTSFGFAGPGLIPLAGDWDGDGKDSVGVYVTETGTFFLRNALSPGPADHAYSFGGPGLVPLVGRW
jgi:hypothetical protein